MTGPVGEACGLYVNLVKFVVNVGPTAISGRLRVTYDLSITNLGRLDFPIQYSPLQLEALFGPSLGGNPEDIVLGVITIGEKMHLTLAFTDMKLRVSEAKGIKENAMKWLANAGSPAQ